MTRERSEGFVRFALGRIKFGAGPNDAVPSDGPIVDGLNVTTEEHALAPPRPMSDSVTVLRVTDIQPYEKNPRQAANPLFDTIKASIRQRGMDAPLKVTRRPGATHYVVAAGGNTRLLAQLQLWQETADPRFEKVPVVITTWRCESDVLAGHLIENEQRADMTFWDKARGIVALKIELERERAAALSLRQWESALTDIGLPVGKDVLSTYLFAVERLAPLGPVVWMLSRNDVRDHLQPCFRRLGRLAQKFGLDEPALCAHTLDPLMLSFAELYQATQSFSAAELAQAADNALAQRLQINVRTLRAMHGLLDQSPELLLTELRTRTSEGTIAAPIGTLADVQPSLPSDASGSHDFRVISPGDKNGMPVRVDHRCTGLVSRGDSPTTHDATVGNFGSVQASDALRQALLSFAEITQCGDCLHWHEELPLHFYVEVPSAPLDLAPARPQRYVGWWLLAFLSGQLDPDLSLLLPSHSRWRQALGADGDCGDEHLPLLIQTELGGPPSPDFLVAWLTRAPDAASERAWQCLELARRAWITPSPAVASDHRDVVGPA
jgi:ParB family protein of integrating conjugative element (PFGI_1 class)